MVIYVPPDINLKQSHGLTEYKRKKTMNAWGTVSICICIHVRILTRTAEEDWTSIF